MTVNLDAKYESLKTDFDVLDDLIDNSTQVLSEAKAERSALEGLDIKVTELLNTDLRGNVTALQMIQLDNRIGSLESSSIPNRVIGLEKEIS